MGVAQMLYGYCRVSDVSQCEDRQVIAMREQSVPEKNIFVEKQSGKDFNRDVYRQMVRRLRVDDVLYIKAIDRLGRNYDEILEQWRILTKEKGVDIVVLDMEILDTRMDKGLMQRVIADVVLTMLSYIAQNERETIRQRQAEGIAAAKARGVRFGRPDLPLPDNFGELVRQWERGKLPLAEVLAQSGLGRSTFYTRLNEYRLLNGQGKPR